MIASILFKLSVVVVAVDREPAVQQGQWQAAVRVATVASVTSIGSPRKIVPAP
mgnify:CR=1 FL=1